MLKLVCTSKSNAKNAFSRVIFYYYGQSHLFATLSRLSLRKSATFFAKYATYRGLVQLFPLFNAWEKESFLICFQPSHSRNFFTIHNSMSFDSSENIKIRIC